MRDALIMSPFVIVGLVFVFLPARVLRFYEWLHGPSFRRLGNEPRHVRNAGIRWLVLLAVILYLDSDR
jgi:hypothetical protein